MVALTPAVGGSVVAHWICNQRVTVSNPVTCSHSENVGSVDFFFLIFKIKKLMLPPFREVFSML